MKTVAMRLIFCPIFLGFFLSSCVKEDFLMAAGKDHCTSTSGVSSRDDRMDFSPCGLQDSNSISITYRRQNGSLAPAICFTETELSTVLKKAGLSEKEARIYLQNAFYLAKNARPMLTRNMGLLIAKGYPLPADYVADCFAMSALGREDYPLNPVLAVEMVQAAQFSGNPPTSFLDYYTIRQARSGSGCNLVKEPGFSGVRFLNTITHVSQTVHIPSLDSLRSIFQQAGFSEEEAESNMIGMMKGEWSILAVWNLFQKQLVPTLPAARALKLQPDAKNWRLSQVGIGLFASDASVETFYYARGDAGIE